MHRPLQLRILDGDIDEGAAAKTGLRCELLGHVEHRLDGVGSRPRPLEALLHQGPSRLRLAFESREGEGLLGVEVVVQRHAGDAGAIGHLVDADIGQAALVEEIRRRIDQAVAWRRSRRHRHLLRRYTDLPNPRACGSQGIVHTGWRAVTLLSVVRNRPHC